MSKSKNVWVYWFKELGISDVPLVGGKNAALGEMYRELTPLGVKIPNGYAVSAEAFRYFVKFNNLGLKIKQALKGLNTHNIQDLARRGKVVRNLILSGGFPEDLKLQILKSYHELSKQYKTNNVDVAVRSSATAEDLPGASFAGQQETYLNIRGEKALLEATKKCFASLFTNRAISYRVDKGFSAFGGGSASGGNDYPIALSVGVQKMVRSDKAVSGVAFTVDTETGFSNVVLIDSVYGLGEMIVQGKVNPDEFVVFKPSLEKGFYPIISKKLSDKNVKMIYNTDSRGLNADKRGLKPVKIVPVPENERRAYSLTDKEVIKLAQDCVKVEQHFSKKHRKYTPMDLEWAKDGQTNELFVVQARPETIHAGKKETVHEEYSLINRPQKALVSGIPIGTKIVSGRVRVINDVKDINTFKKGEVLVTEITDPDWEPIMKIASAIITDKGGRTSHAAIVSRELGVQCIVGSGSATRALRTGQVITVDCSGDEAGRIYPGVLKFKVMKHSLKNLPKIKTKISLNIGSPDEAFRYHSLPVSGVGLGRLEFIIASKIRVHPNVLIDYEKLKSGRKTVFHHSKAEILSILRKVEDLTAGYKDKKQYYVDKLAEGISMIAATFWPNEVIIRFSDFKTNEYETLLGGSIYEPKEENPMIGWRGASRYYDPNFAAAFGLECIAVKKVREKMGLTNVVPMVPFCRTIEEGKKTLAVMAKNGLKRQSQSANRKSLKNNRRFAISDLPLKVYMMAEIPSNVILIDEFLKLFDGLSIGSNDLTQLTLGLDRDSGIIAHIANENNQSVKDLIKIIVQKCNQKKKYVGICGQAPSDYPEFAVFLKKIGIQAMSLNPDSVIKTLIALGKKK